MDDVLKCFNEGSGAATSDDKLLRAYDKLSNVLKNLKHDDSARRKLQNPTAVALLAGRFLMDTRVFPSAEKGTKKSPVLMKALKALGFFMHCSSLCALLPEEVSAAICQRLCEIMRQSTSRSAQHTAVWCVSVETLRKRQQCWEYFQAMGAMLGGSGLLSSQGSSGTAAAETGSAATHPASFAQSSSNDALESDALKAIAVLVPIVREDVLHCSAASIAEWAPPVYTRLLSESSKVRDGAAQVVNALLVHIVPLPEALSACFVRDVSQLGLVSRFRSVFFSDVSNEALVCSGAAAWGIMAGLLGRSIFRGQQAKDFLDLSDFFFSHSSISVRSAAFTSWSFVVQALTREVTEVSERGQKMVNMVMKPFANTLSVGEQSSDVLTSAFKCWMTLAVKLDAQVLIASFNAVISDFAQRLASVDSAPDFIVTQLCSLFDNLFGDTDARALPVSSSLTLAWLRRQSVALCYPFHVILRRSTSSPQCQALIPVVVSFLTSFMSRLSDACKLVSPSATEDDKDDCAECMKVATSLAVVLVQKLAASSKESGSFTQENWQLFNSVFIELPVITNGLCASVMFKLNVDSPSAQTPFSLSDHLLCLLATLFFGNSIPSSPAEDGSANGVFSLLVQCFSRSLQSDLMHSHSGFSFSTISRTLSTATVGLYSRHDHCKLWSLLADAATKYLQTAAALTSVLRMIFALRLQTLWLRRSHCLAQIQNSAKSFVHIGNLLHLL